MAHQRRAQLGLVVLQILARDEAVVLSHGRHEGLGSRAGIKGLRTALGDGGKRAGQVRLPEDCAGLIEISVVQEDVARAVELFQEGALGAKILGRANS